MRTLARKSSGLDVHQLQRTLDITADGIFGSGTEAAVMKFQRSKTLRDDGVVGTNTHRALAAHAAAKGKPYDQSLGQGLVKYDVPFLPQPNTTSCWAASMAMLVSYGNKPFVGVTPQQIADPVGLSLDSSYGWDVLYSAINYWRLRQIPSQSFTAEGWVGALKQYGPLWLVETGAPTHAVVLTGGDGGWFFVNNPWPPGVGKANEVKSLQKLTDDFGGAAGPSGGNVQLLYEVRA